MNQDNNTRVLHHRFSPGPSNHAIKGTRCSLANGLEIAVVVISQKVGDIEQFTANDSHNALFFQALYRDKLARQIVAYLREYAFSGDTLEGISRWWVKQQRVSECVNDVHRALVQLGNEGLVYERTMPDGRTLFFANMLADKCEEVEDKNGFGAGEIR
jgi:hypothetical protein